MAKEMNVLSDEKFALRCKGPLAPSDGLPRSASTILGSSSTVDPEEILGRFKPYEKCDGVEASPYPPAYVINKLMSANDTRTRRCYFQHWTYQQTSLLDCYSASMHSGDLCGLHSGGGEVLSFPDHTEWGSVCNTVDAECPSDCAAARLSLAGSTFLPTASINGSFALPQRNNLKKSSQSEVVDLHRSVEAAVSVPTGELENTQGRLTCLPKADVPNSMRVAQRAGRAITTPQQEGVRYSRKPHCRAPTPLSPVPRTVVDGQVPRAEQQLAGGMQPDSSGLHIPSSTCLLLGDTTHLPAPKLLSADEKLFCTVMGMVGGHRGVFSNLMIDFEEMADIDWSTQRIEYWINTALGLAEEHDFFKAFLTLLRVQRVVESLWARTHLTVDQHSLYVREIGMRMIEITQQWMLWSSGEDVDVQYEALFESTVKRLLSSAPSVQPSSCDAIPISQNVHSMETRADDEESLASEQVSSSTRSVTEGQATVREGRGSKQSISSGSLLFPFQPMMCPQPAGDAVNANRNRSVTQRGNSFHLHTFPGPTFPSPPKSGADTGFNKERSNKGDAQRYRRPHTAHPRMRVKIDKIPSENTSLAGDISVRWDDLELGSFGCRPFKEVGSPVSASSITSRHPYKNDFNAVIDNQRASADEALNSCCATYVPPPAMTETLRYNGSPRTSLNKLNVMDDAEDRPEPSMGALRHRPPPCDFPEPSHRMPRQPPRPTSTGSLPPLHNSVPQAEVPISSFLTDDIRQSAGEDETMFIQAQNGDFQQPVDGLAAKPLQRSPPGDQELQFGDENDTRGKVKLAYGPTTSTVCIAGRHDRHNYPVEGAKRRVVPQDAPNTRSSSDVQCVAVHSSADVQDQFDKDVVNGLICMDSTTRHEVQRTQTQLEDDVHTEVDTSNIVETRPSVDTDSKEVMMLSERQMPIDLSAIPRTYEELCADPLHVFFDVSQKYTVARFVFCRLAQLITAKHACQCHEPPLLRHYLYQLHEAQEEEALDLVNEFRHMLQEMVSGYQENNRSNPTVGSSFQCNTITGSGHTSLALQLLDLSDAYSMCLRSSLKGQQDHERSPIGRLYCSASPIRRKLPPVCIPHRGCTSSPDASFEMLLPAHNVVDSLGYSAKSAIPQQLVRKHSSYSDGRCRSKGMQATYEPSSGTAKPACDLIQRVDVVTRRTSCQDRIADGARLARVSCRSSFNLPSESGYAPTTVSRDVDTQSLAPCCYTSPTVGDTTDHLLGTGDVAGGTSMTGTNGVQKSYSMQYHQFITPTYSEPRDIEASAPVTFRPESPCPRPTCKPCCTPRATSPASHASTPQSARNWRTSKDLYYQREYKNSDGSLLLTPKEWLGQRRSRSPTSPGARVLANDECVEREATPDGESDTDSNKDPLQKAIPPPAASRALPTTFPSTRQRHRIYSAGHYYQFSHPASASSARSSRPASAAGASHSNMDLGSTARLSLVSESLDTVAASKPYDEFEPAIRPRMADELAGMGWGR